MSELKVTRKEHLGYTEWQNNHKANPELAKKYEVLKEPMFGRWQYMYEYKGEEFSLIRFQGKMMEVSYGKNLWEVLFPDNDVMRFETKKQAEEYILANY